MKTFIALITLIFLTAFAQASESQVKESLFKNLSQETVDGTWITLSTICYYNYGSTPYTDSEKACKDDLEALNLLTNDKVVFQSHCSDAEGSCLAKGGMAQLNSKILFIGK